MSKFHINDNNQIMPCGATIKCKFGIPLDKHYSDMQEAEIALGAKLGIDVIPKIEINRHVKTVKMFETIHGSHLYGLSRPDSDVDFYRVEMVAGDIYVPFQAAKKIKSKQKIADGDDLMSITLTDFMVKAHEGVPQALEAMFSEHSTAKGPLDPFRRSYYLDTANFTKTYRRTCLNFARLGLEDEKAIAILTPEPTDADMQRSRTRESLRKEKPRRVERNGMEKYRRHALRLMFNYEEGIERGRFQPTMTEAQKEYIYTNMELDDIAYARLVKSRVPVNS